MIDRNDLDGNVFTIQNHIRVGIVEKDRFCDEFRPQVTDAGLGGNRSEGGIQKLLHAQTAFYAGVLGDLRQQVFYLLRGAW